MSKEPASGHLRHIFAHVRIFNSSQVTFSSKKCVLFYVGLKAASEEYSKQYFQF